jgi:hypothetical protein
MPTSGCTAATLKYMRNVEALQDTFIILQFTPHRKLNFFPWLRHSEFLPNTENSPQDILFM